MANRTRAQRRDKKEEEEEEDDDDDDDDDDHVEVDEEVKTERYLRSCDIAPIAYITVVAVDVTWMCNTHKSRSVPQALSLKEKRSW